jgi:Leucine-rich repeat (LRR) protein
MGAKVSVTSSEVAVTNKGHTELPYHRSARDFTKLKSANFSRNSISTFPKQLGTDLRTYPPIIDTLVELDLSSNELESLPDEICLLINLKKLKLEGNRITRLPNSFPALYKLEKLYLNNNELTELPLDMANMVNLKILRLHHNRLFWLPNDIGRMRLSELTIHENPLREEILEIGELEEVLAYFRSQPLPQGYAKALKAHIMAAKIKDGLHELKEGRLHAFRVILASDEARIFQAFLEKEVAVENLQFYRDSDAFRSRFCSNFPIVSKELRDAGLELYKKYIEEVPEQHKFSINIPISVKKKIDEAFSPNSSVFPDQWVFADAYVAIAKLMFEDSFKRFLETSEGKRVWSMYESHASVGKKASTESSNKKPSTPRASSSSSRPKVPERLEDSDEE